MELENFKTKDKDAALAAFGRHLDSPDTICAEFQYEDGEYSVEIYKPVNEVFNPRPADQPLLTHHQD